MDVCAVDRETGSDLDERLCQLGEAHVARLPMARRERAQMMGERSQVAAEQLLDDQLVRLIPNLGERQMAAGKPAVRRLDSVETGGVDVRNIATLDEGAAKEKMYYI